MPIVEHKFLDHKINSETETLIIGTFNPATQGNDADFFYGRPHNFLWKLLPGAWDKPSLKGMGVGIKEAFIKKYKIDFIDLIERVEVDQPKNYYDKYLDNRVKDWREIIPEIQKLPNLKSVCLTRKTLTGIPKMQERIEKIKEYCDKKGIEFHFLTTPARFYSLAKQQEWTKFLRAF